MPASTRSLVLAFVVGAAVAVAAVPAVAHPPDQHDPQLLPESALGVFNVEARMARTLSATCEDGMAGPYPCENVDLAGFTPLPLLGGATGNDIWGWTDPESGREYAIMGTSNSTGFVDVTDPANPTLVGVLPTAGVPDYVLWRDVKVSGNYAYIVAEVTDAGLQVFDLTRLRDETGIFDADAHYTEFGNAHNVHVNPASDTVYAVGSNTCRNEEADNQNEENGGLHMVDVSDPLNPTFAGCAVVQNDRSGGDERSDNYVHDVECIIYDGPDSDYTGREICFGSNEDVVVIYDVTDKSDPQVISATGYPTAAYTHQGTLTEDRRYFLFGDELDEQEESLNTTTYILDISDLDAPPTPKAFEHGTGSIDHNMYVHGNRVFQSNYMAGLRILEFDNESLAAGQLREVGYFDVVPGGDVAEFAGTWSNYRFPGSGNVVVSAIENEISGLFVLTPRLAPKSPNEQAPPAGTPQPQPQNQAQPQEQPVAPPARAADDACKPSAGFERVGVRRLQDGRQLRFDFARRTTSPVLIDVFQTSRGRGILRNTLVARFGARERAATWNGRDRAGNRLRDGYYFVRFRIRQPDGRADIRRVTLRRKHGRFFVAKPFYGRVSCALLSSAKLRSPVFGGRQRRALRIAFAVTKPSRVSVTVFRGKKRMHRFGGRLRAAEVMQRLTVRARQLKPRGTYRVRIVAVSGGTREHTTLYARRL